MLCGGKQNIQSKHIILDIYYMRYIEQKLIDELSTGRKYTLLFGCYAVYENCSSTIFITNSTHFKPEVGQTFLT